MQAILSEPFEVARDAPLFRWRLIKLAADRFIWLQTYHHLIIDGLGRPYRLAEADPLAAVLG